MSNCSQIIYQETMKLRSTIFGLFDVPPIFPTHNSIDVLLVYSLEIPVYFTFWDTFYVRIM